MHQTYKNKTTFYTDKKLPWYKIMPHKLVNAWAIYERMVNNHFNSKSSTYIKAYVDDIFVMDTKG